MAEQTKKTPFAGRKCRTAPTTPFYVLLFTGIVLVAAGCALIAPALGCLAGGAECLALSWLYLLGVKHEEEGEAH